MDTVYPQGSVEGRREVADEERLELPPYDEFLQLVLWARDAMPLTAARSFRGCEGMSKAELEHALQEEGEGTERIEGYLQVLQVGIERPEDGNSNDLSKRDDITSYLEQEAKLLGLAADTKTEFIDARNLVLFCCSVRASVKTGGKDLPDMTIIHPIKIILQRKFAILFEEEKLEVSP